MSFWYKYWRCKGHVAKQLVEQFVGIDVSWMYKKKALFDPKGETIALLGVKLIFFSDRVEVFCFYPLTPCLYRIEVNRTQCHFGGSRPWFLCPHPNCGGRYRKLYLHPEGALLCRKLSLIHISEPTRPY